MNSFPTYLYQGISRPPTLRISDNYNERICAFLYAPYSNIGFRLNGWEPKFCLIIKKLKRQQDKIAELIMIADVVYKDKKYYLMDENGRELCHDWESKLGVLMGFSGVMTVFRIDKKYYVYDDHLKEIAHNWESSLGEFRSVSGNYVNFRMDKKIYTRDSYLREVSHRWE